MTPRRLRPRLPRFAYRISLRLLVINLLVVFLPVMAVLALGTYERQLLASLEHALVQQARVLASALSGGEALDVDAADHILAELAARHDARLRVVDGVGRLVADSSLPAAADEVTLATPGDTRSRADAVVDDATATVDEPGQRDSLLYRLASGPVRLWRRYLGAPAPPLEDSEFYSGAIQLDGGEVRAALAGRYGAATRISSGGQVSVTLYSAIPIWGNDREVLGAVLASQSTFRILTDLYDLRLDLFRIFLLSVAAAVALTLFLSATITR